MAKDKKIRPLKWLLLIPIQVIIDAIVMWGATYLDSVIYSVNKEIMSWIKK